MAQTGFTPIQLYSTSTAAAAPVAGNLTNSTLGSELAINITDGKLFYKDNANAVQVIGWKTVPTTAGGTGLTTYTAGDLSYYASGTTLTKLAIGTAGQILTSTGTAPQWTTLSGVAVTTFSAGTTGFTPNSATSGAVTLAGTLVVSNGGTGLTSLTAGYVPYGNGTSAFASSANFFFDGTNLGLGTSTPSTGSLNRQLTINSGATNLAGVIIQNNATGTAFNNGFQIFANGLNAFVNNESNGYLVFNTNAIERVRIAAAGDVSVVTGNLVISTSGKGIDFSATPGTGTSELLADYEEGTWTPVITADAGTFTTVTVGDSVYTKIGRFVQVTCKFTLTNIGTGTTSMTIDGLPFTSSIAGREMQCSGRRLTDGVGLAGMVFNAQIILINKFDNTSAIISGNVYTITAYYSV
jgi:hypothetical protein